MKLNRILVVGLLVAAQPAGAEDLLQVFRDAQRYDATYSAARNNLAAGRERLPQGRALILPTLNLSANATRQRIDTESRDVTISPSFLRNPDSNGYTLTFSQPLFRAQNWLQYQQGEFQVRQAEATFGQATQDLIVRVAQAYFDVLGQYDTLTLVRAQKAATSEQLAQAKRNFEVGTATITDTHEAQARYDLINAQEIAAQNDLQARRRQLQLITGKEYTELKLLRGDIRLSPPNPDNVETWAELAEKQSYTVLACGGGSRGRLARGEARHGRPPADARFRRAIRPERRERLDHQLGRARHHQLEHRACSSRCRCSRAAASPRASGRPRPFTCARRTTSTTRAAPRSSPRASSTSRRSTASPR